MEECELCGRQTKDVYVLNIEGVEMRSCAKCAEGKKVVRAEIDKPKQQARPGSQRPPRRNPDEPAELIDNYGKVIHDAREHMHLPLKVLGEMLSEKEHLLLRIEEERTKPTVELTKKLERVLGIKLTEEQRDEKKVSVGRPSAGATLGDFMEGKG